MCALTNYDDLVDAAQVESVDVIISGAGLPLKLPSLIKNDKTKLVPIVSSSRAARLSVVCGREDINAFRMLLLLRVLLPEGIWAIAWPS